MADCEREECVEKKMCPAISAPYGTAGPKEATQWECEANVQDEIAWRGRLGV